MMSVDCIGYHGHCAIRQPTTTTDLLQFLEVEEHLQRAAHLCLVHALHTAAQHFLRGAHSVAGQAVGAVGPYMMAPRLNNSVRHWSRHQFTLDMHVLINIIIHK